MYNDQLYALELVISGSKDTLTPNHTYNTIPYDSIVSLSITESILTLLPKIEVVIADKHMFIESGPVMDKDYMHVVLNSSLEDPLTEVSTVFTINSVKIMSDTLENQGTYVQLTGYMTADKTFSPYICDAINGSSDDVIGKKAKDMGLKFKSDATGYENNYWYQSGNNYQFIKYVSNRAYIPNDGVFVYGTLDGTINYTSIKTKNAIGVVLTAQYNRERVNNNVLTKEDAGLMFYDGYDIMDLTSQYNTISNYGGHLSKYDLTKFTRDSIVNNDKSTFFINKKKENFNVSVFDDIIGVIGDKNLVNTIYNGKIQNTYARFQLFSNSISININNSTKVSLFDKVEFGLQSTTDPSTDAEPYSGEYLVTSISHSIAKDVSYSKSVLLCRNGINKSVTKKDYIGVL